MTKIAFITHGCTNNFAESELMAGMLKKAGFPIAKKEEADIIILNICTVKGEKTALDAIEEAKKLGKKIILAGCIPQESYTQFREALPDSCFVSTHNIKDIVSIVEEARNDSVVDDIAFKNEVKLGERLRGNPAVGIIPILSGCTNSCSYCSVKLIKGNLLSFPEQEIMKEAKQAIDEGCKELWVTSMDNSCYGLDKGKAALPELVKKIANFPGEFKIRIGMMNPKNLIKFADEMIEAYKNEKVFKFLHVPVQSGNNEILKAMNRNYTAEEFLSVIEKFESAIPNLTISTDIICGFPGETEEQFNDSIELVSNLKPDILNISRFVARKGTKAEAMENQVHGNITKERSRILTSRHENLGKMKNERWMGWQGSAIVDEKNPDGTFVARNYAYKPILINSSKDIFNKIVNVKIKKTQSHYLTGEIAGA